MHGLSEITDGKITIIDLCTEAEVSRVLLPFALGAGGEGDPGKRRRPAVRNRSNRGRRYPG